MKNSTRKFLFKRSIKEGKKKITLSELFGYKEIKDYTSRFVTKAKKDIKNKTLHTYEGMLFYGRPGNGKTLLAEALATELGTKIYMISMSDILDSAQAGFNKIEAIFEKVSQEAKKTMKPVILLLDEMDLFANKRYQNMSVEQREVLQLFLTFLDGEKINREGIIIIGCTNNKENIDEAILRPGRLGKHIYFQEPQREDVALFIKHMLVDKGITIDDQTFTSIINTLCGKSAADITRILRAILNSLPSYNTTTLSKEIFEEEPLLL
jgi:SpoVK/Ycf46/Vps4 family AAA+-type ATPase